MKSFFILLFVTICTVSVFAQQPQGKLSDTGKKPDKIIDQVKKEKAYLIDVRTAEEYNAGHLKYSRNIDFKSPDFKAKVSKLDKSRPVYLYCRSGNRSGKAVDTLKAVGFTKPWNIGGLDSLKAEGIPSE